MKKQDTIRKIKALLAKTTQNGASEQEALSALNKAQELMREYHVSQSDLEEKPDFVFGVRKRKRSIYPLFGFEHNLGKLFCCEVVTIGANRSSDLLFFGEQHNVTICMYFYEFIIKSCKYEIKVYKKTDAFQLAKKNYNVHGKFIIKSFVIGFIDSIDNKLSAMNKSNITRDKDYGLIVLTKQDKVKQELSLLIDVNYRNQSKGVSVVPCAVDRGKQKGEQTPLSKGIKTKPKPEALQLEM